MLDDPSFFTMKSQEQMCFINGRETEGHYF